MWGTRCSDRDQGGTCRRHQSTGHTLRLELQTAQEVYLHPYCLVVTRLDKTHIPALGHIYLLASSYNHPVEYTPIIAWAVEHARYFYHNYRDGNGDFLLQVCVCVFAWEKRERRVLGIEGLLSVVTCIGFLNACTRQSHNSPPNPTTREPCLYCLVCLSYLMHQSSLSRSSCRSQVSVPLIS